VAEDESKRRVTIVGTGAMACLFGALLASRARVTLTGTWRQGLAAICASGIIIGEPQRDVARRVNTAAWGDHVEPADLVLVLVKSWQTEEAARRLPRLLKPGGVVLTLQNGLGNLEALGPGACLGVTYLGATLLGPGRVQPGGSGVTCVAGPEWIVDLFNEAGIEAERRDPGQVDGLLWAKLAINCGINALTALLRVRNGELLRRPDAAGLMERAALECAAVAAAKGIFLPFADAARRTREVAQLTAANRSSMLQDMLRGTPTEIDAINGATVRWGSCLGVPTPVNEILFRLVRAAVSTPSATQLRKGSDICKPSSTSPI
jgi:2-dehydropantoate 2-reductase